MNIWKDIPRSHTHHAPLVPPRDSEDYRRQVSALGNTRGSQATVQPVPLVVRVEPPPPVIPTPPPLPPKSKLRKSGSSKEEEKRRFLNVYDSNGDKFPFREPTSRSHSGSSRISPASTIGQAQILRPATPIPDHRWSGSSATIPRYFPDGPNWNNVPLTELDRTNLRNSGISLSVDPQDTPSSRSPQSITASTGDSVQGLFFSKPQVPINLTDIFRVVLTNLEEI